MLKKREVGAKFKTYPIRELTHDWLKRKHDYEATWKKVNKHKLLSRATWKKVKKQKKEDEEKESCGWGSYKNQEKENSFSWGETSW